MIPLPVKRALFWTLFAAAAVVSVWWTLHMSYRPGAVLEVIPVQAAWVSVHDRPADRWPEWSRNGAVRSAFSAAGADWDGIVKELEAPKGRTWLRRLGGREAALAFVPAMPYSGEPAWILSCWAGGYGQRLRWLMALSGAKPIPGPGGDLSHAVWLMKMAGLPAGMHVAMGIREGVVLFALSPDALSAVRAGLDAADSGRHHPRLPETAASAADRGLLRTADGAEWTVVIPELTAAKLRVSAVRPGVPAALPAEASAGDPAVLDALLGRAEGSVTLPWTWIRNKLLPGSGSWIGPVDMLVREASGSETPRVVLAVYGGEHAARIRSLFGGGVEAYIQGLKVPTFVAAVPVADEQTARAAAGRFLDRFNRIKPYGLVPRPAGTCYGWPVTALEATRGEIYKDFAPSEQAAYAIAGGWLVVGSHLGALEGLLPYIQHERRPPAAPVAGASVRVDGMAFSQTLDKFLAALSLVYLASDTPGAHRGRREIETWRGWIQAIGPLGQIEAAVKPGAEGTQVELSAAAFSDVTK